jgi:hypothetical protein
MNQKKTKIKIGSTMLFAVLVLSFILIMGLSVAQTIFIEQRLTSGYKESQAAYFAAESGIEYAMKNTGCFPGASDDIVWLDGESQKVGFRVWDEGGMTHSLGISNGIKRELTAPTTRRSSLVLDNAGEVLINNLPTSPVDYSCMNAAYASLIEDANVGTNILKLDSVSGFAVGDGVYIYQNYNKFDSDYTEIIYNSVGAKQESEITSVDIDSNTITIKDDTIKLFPGVNRTQVLSIKRFGSIEISGNTTLTAPGFNGIKGGILALDAGSLLSVGVGASIDMVAKGYRGGLSGSNGEGPGGGKLSDLRLAGGGGGYGGLGGTAEGGVSPGGSVYAGWVWNAPPKAPFMGSGGAAGKCNADNFANGGGLIMLSSDRLSIQGSIKADGGGGNGKVAASLPPDCVDDYGGGSGGGSGGGINITSSIINFNGYISAAGGGGSGFYNGGNYDDEDGSVGVNGYGGDGGEGGTGGPPGSPGAGGNARESRCDIGGRSAGGSGCNWSGLGLSYITGGGGGGAGVILIKYKSFNNHRTLLRIADTPGASNKIGPYAYFWRIY